MIKNIVIAVLVLVVGVGIYQYINVWEDTAEKLEAANLEKEKLSASKQALAVAVDSLTNHQKGLEQTIATKEEKIAGFDAQIKTLQDELEKANHVALVEISKEKIIADLRDAYGESEKNIKGLVIKETTKSGRVFENEFIAIALDVAKLATLSKNSENSLAEQNELHGKIRGLTDEIAQLKDKNLVLEKEKSQHYLKAYDEAYASFQILHDNYVALLKAPPKVEFDLAPKWLQIVGGTVGGIAIGGLR